ncbi:MAG TPA: hypothetical protein VMY37_22285 [Thermoguttaceae bacterium]|nr:hypothetical protein [Thermoguttaceae bacterium]
MFGQNSRRDDVVLTSVFLLYVALVCTVAWHHEPWFDEGQAWLIARDSGLTEILCERVRYEGTPGLWHLMLFLPAKLGLPYATLTLISVVIAVATVYLFLRYSPFPWYVKLIFPFGFFTLYQYAVVARSYGPMALLLVAIAALFHKRNRHPILFFTLLALLANANAHGFIIAGFLAVYHLWHLWLDRSEMGAKCLWQHGIGALVLGLIAILVVILVRPPDDLCVPGMGIKPWNARMLLDAFTPYRYLSVVVLAASMLWFARQKTLHLWAGPTVALLWLFIFKCGSPWHQGVIYYYWVFCVWLSWQTEAGRRAASQTPPHAWAFRGAAATLTLVVAFHVYWGVVCSYHDVLYPYSGSREAYAYLAEHHLDQREIYAQGFSTVSVLPYFTQNIFDNYHDKQNPSYFLWAKGNPLMTRSPSVCGKAPEFVLVGVKYKHDHGLARPEYQLIRRFEGRMFWKDTILERDSLHLYRRRTAEVAAN